MDFRFTYGVINGMEIGAVVPSNISEILFGIKYGKELIPKLYSGIIVGYHLPVGEGPVGHVERSYNDRSKVCGGLVFSYMVTEHWSVDANLQMQKCFSSTLDKHKNDLFYSVDVGYYLIEWLQPVLAFSDTKNTFKDIAISKTSLYPGCTIEPAENFLMVLTFPIDISGRNTEKSSGFTFALTVSFD